MLFNNFKTGVRYGVLAGFLTVGLYIILWLTNKEFVFNPFIWWASLGIYMYFMIRAARELGDGGLKPYQIVLRDAFGVFVFANAIFYLFYWILITQVDPSLVEVQQQVMVKAYENHGKSIDEQTKITIEAFSFGNTFFRYAYSLLGGFLLSLVSVVLARH